MKKKWVNIEQKWKRKIRTNSKDPDNASKENTGISKAKAITKDILG
jgi:hypothetical protein